MWQNNNFQLPADANFLLAIMPAGVNCKLLAGGGRS
jgi:hypothetical protein